MNRKTILSLILFGSMIFGLASQAINLPEIVSTSQLEPKTRKFNPSFAMDGRLNTSWVEGALGDGIGESLTIKYKEPVNFQNLSIYNGFGDPKLWGANNRVKKMKLKTEDGTEEIITLKDRLSLQTIELKKEISSKEVSLTILEVYKGTRKDNTSIAEMAFHSTQSGSILIAPKNTWAIGKWKTESNIAKISLHNDGTCEMGYETAKMLCTWTESGKIVVVNLEATLPLTNTDRLELRFKGDQENPKIEINGKHLFVVNRDEV
ncbi:MAG: nicotine adenine dinucleotide glycohydrolase [Leptospira sp.]|nr:nicotine adenine dinucleotide glycohydrolase [Leptospira sp.]